MSIRDIIEAAKECAAQDRCIYCPRFRRRLFHRSTCWLDLKRKEYGL